MKISELIYKFPIEAPFLSPHVDVFKAGAHLNFERSDTYLIAACGMTTFAACEPVAEPSAITFSAALMKILLRQSICHTLVLDKDSKFFGVFCQVVDLLQLNCHTLSGGNHDGMLVKRINRYLNKGLFLMINERASVCVALEAI